MSKIILRTFQKIHINIEKTGERFFKILLFFLKLAY